MIMIHKHHIVPRHMGGTDDPSNIVELTIEDHAEAHRQLYEQHGKQEDYVAWKCLLGVMEVEEKVSRLCSMGGTIIGGRNRDSGHMARIARAIPIDKRLEFIARGVEKQRSEQSGSFFNPDLHREAARKGGAAQGKVNAESGHLKEIAQEYWARVKAGELPPRRKARWFTNGTESLFIYEGNPIPDGFFPGRTRQKKL